MKAIALPLTILCSQTVQGAVEIPVKRDILVPNETTAIVIAKAVLAPIYGVDLNQNRA
jgi:hypothetical protein